MAFKVTSATIDDRAPVDNITQEFQDKLYGDRGKLMLLEDKLLL